MDDGVDGTLQISDVWCVDDWQLVGVAGQRLVDALDCRIRAAEERDILRFDSRLRAGIEQPVVAPAERDDADAGLGLEVDLLERPAGVCRIDVDDAPDERLGRLGSAARIASGSPISSKTIFAMSPAASLMSSAAVTMPSTGASCSASPGCGRPSSDSSAL